MCPPLARQPAVPVQRWARASSGQREFSASQVPKQQADGNQGEDYLQLARQHQRTVQKGSLCKIGPRTAIIQHPVIKGVPRFRAQLSFEDGKYVHGRTKMNRRKQRFRCNSNSATAARKSGVALRKRVPAVPNGTKI